MGKRPGRARGMREAHADLHVPTELSKKKTTKQQKFRRVRGNRTEVDPKVQEALKYGVQADKKKINYEKFKHAKKEVRKERRAIRAVDRRQNNSAKLVPKTKENARRPVLGMVDDANDLEIKRDEQMDEFSTFFAQTREKVPEFDELPQSDDDLELEELARLQEEREQQAHEEELARQEKLAAEHDNDDDDAEAKVADDDDDDEEKQWEDVAEEDNDQQQEGDGDAAPAAADGDDKKKEKPKRMINPRILITTCQNAHYRTRLFVREALHLFPNSIARARRNYTVQEIVEYCTDAGFKHVIVIGERIKQPFEMMICHLPHGPTATFRISNFLPHKELENPAERTKHYPELILKNFDTRLGRRVARLLESCFPATRDYAGRACLTILNQRDYMFVRMHRYVFADEDSKKTEARIQELGPRFTLRLMSLQKGTFDRMGEYEWIRKKVHDEDKLEWYL